MQLRTQHYLQVDVGIVVLIVAFLLLLGRLAAETSGAIAVGSNQPIVRGALGDRLLDDALFPNGDQELGNRGFAGFSPGLGVANSGAELLRTGQFFSDAYGHDFGNGFKVEIERLTYDTGLPGASRIATGGVRTTGSVLSGLYEFRNDGWLLKPYVGVGLGVADPTAGLLVSDDRFLLPGFQLRGGVDYSITQKLFGKLEYRWSQGNKPSLGVEGIPADFQLRKGGFRVGLNYRLQ
jgi:opacity protein-like surface antigen